MKKTFLILALLITSFIPVKADSDVSSDAALAAPAATLVATLATPAATFSVPYAITTEARPISFSQVDLNPGRIFKPVSRNVNFEKTLFATSLAAMVALNVADYLSTRQALKYQGLEEGNPFMKPFVKNSFAFAAVKAGTTALAYISMKSIRKRNKTTAWILSTATNFLLSCVVANNLSNIQKAKRT